MVTNEHQARITRGKNRKLKQELDRFQQTAGESNVALHQALVLGVQAQVQELMEDLEQYRKIRSGERTVLALETLEDLPHLPMMARVAQGMSQRAQAQRLGMKEQQIQRYEATRYQSASLKRVLGVAKALGVEIRDQQVVLVPR